MHDDRLNYVLREFIADDYVETECSEYLLTEDQDSGYTQLMQYIQGENLSIARNAKKNR